jgi:hypothetical protein
MTPTSELAKRLEKDNEEIKQENRKLRYIIEDKNQEQIKMLKREIMRQRVFDKKAQNFSEKIIVILMAVFIISNMIQILFPGKRI